MKKVGITTRFVSDSDYSIPVVGLTDSYAKSVRAVGGLPLYIPVEDLGSLSEAERANLLLEWSNTFDALILSGGEDVDCNLYGQPAHEKLGTVCKTRDQFEIELFKAFLKTGKKVLGVCRGHQLVNVALGGSLYQDIPSFLPSSLEHSSEEDKWFSCAHTVQLDSKTTLQSLLKKDNFSVNSIHHQSIDKVASSLKVVAKSEDGVIEACESTEFNNLITVQWHPETMWQKPLQCAEQLELFRWLVN